jgi:hypothetical protein
MKPPAHYIKAHPRISSALAFGAATALALQMAWVAHQSIPALSTAAGIAHAAAGAIMGRKLFDAARTPDARRAALRGMQTSLIALIIGAPLLGLYVASGMKMAGIISYFALIFWTAVFAFLGAGWALLLVSAGVGMLLHRAAGKPKASLP